METIFDFNPTSSEVSELIGNISKEDYLSFITQDSAFMDLAYLFYYRRNKKKAKEYIEKTKNVDFINSFWRTVEHP